MTHHADPLHDGERLLEIAELELDSPEVEEMLQEFAEQAAESLGLPQAMVSILLDDAQHFAAMHGVEGWIAAARDTPVEWSFCQHTVRRNDAFVVEDALTDDLMRDSPLVQLEGQRCYVGVPIVSSRGNVLGSFCVTGPDARSFAPEEIDQLHGYAARVVERIEQRHHD